MSLLLYDRETVEGDATGDGGGEPRTQKLAP
jgi:hypothetical protein